MATVARHVRVTGRVQGVFFRAWTREQAARHDVNGWIRNCADGSVEAHVVGDENCVTRMVERMQRGPANARVDDFQVEEVEANEVTGRFEVRH